MSMIKRDDDSRKQLSSPRTASDAVSPLQDVLNQTKTIRNESRDLTRDAVSRLLNTEESAINSMSNLGAQSNKLHKSKRDMDLAKAHEKTAEEQMRELKRLGKFFAFKNPFRKNRDKRLLQKQMEISDAERRREEEETRRSELESKQRLRLNNNSTDESRKLRQQEYSGNAKMDSDLYDEEDLAAEAEISANLDEIGDVTSRLKQMALTMNDELGHQNKLISTLDTRAGEAGVRINQINMRVNKHV